MNKSITILWAASIVMLVYSYCFQFYSTDKANAIAEHTTDDSAAASDGNSTSSTTEATAETHTPTQHSTKNSESEISKAARKTTYKMVRSINSRDLNTIALFFDYYASDNASFLKETHLYDDTGALVESETLDMDKKEYVKYLYDIVKMSEEYSISVSINDIKEESNTILLTIELRELLLQPLDDDQNSTSTDDSILKITAYSSCSLVYEDDGVPIITGMNCIEKIASGLASSTTTSSQPA